MTRSELFTAVLEATHRPDYASYLPTALLYAEAKIARELRCMEMSATDDLTLTDGAVALPADFLDIRSVYDSCGPLQQVGLHEYRSDNYNTRVYALVNNQIMAHLNELTIDYFARPAAMAADGDTTAVLAAHPDVYVSLVSFYVLKRSQDIELAGTELDSYNDARDNLNALADRQMGAPRLRSGYHFGGARGF